MILIIGLGNPGPEYQFSRHNLGFLIIDIISESWGIPLNKSAFFSVYGVGVFEGKKVCLIKPQTFMNASGRSVKLWFEKVEVSPDTVLVIHDDLDLPFGKVKLKKGGGHGGHRGLISIIDESGVSDFSRLRIGVGRPPGKEHDREAIVEWLLRPMSQEELDQLEHSFKKAKFCIEQYVLCGIERAMGECNKGS